MSDFFSSLSLMNEQWMNAENFYREEKYEYNTYEELKSVEFYNWMFQVLDKAIHTLLVDTVAIKTLYRAAKKVKCDYDRFIPKEEHASVNRMNGKDKLYYYFGASYKDIKREAITTCIHEIRATDNDISVCKFELVGDLEKIKIVDFTLDKTIPTDEEGAWDYIKKHARKYGEENGSIKAITKMLIGIFNRSVAFEPINKEDISDEELKYKYIPFWAITDYLESTGYDGMMFSSTVDEGGKNLVLFDLEKAHYIEGTIESFNSSDYLKYRI